METFAGIPSYGSSVRQQPQTAVVKFGDGYEQRNQTDINTAPQSWNLSFNNRTPEGAKAILDFFIARAGREAFKWRPPGETAYRKFVCENWDKNFGSRGNYAVTATFREVFDLG